MKRSQEGRVLRARRRARLLAAALSLGFHLGFVVVFLGDFTAPYVLPAASAPAAEVEIVPALQVERLPPPKPRAPPPLPPARVQVAPEPAPTLTPAPQQARRLSVPVSAAPAKAPPVPLAAAPSLHFAPTPLPQAPTPAPAPSTPSAALSPAPLASLKVRKSARKAPAGVPSLPIGPARSPASPAAPAAGGSLLGSLTPWPGGAMPSGGRGLRGSLIGCANAGAVGLSAAERTRCAERFGQDMADAPVLDGIPPARRAEFDKAAARQERDRKYRDSTPIGAARPHSNHGIAYGPGSAIPHGPESPEGP